MITFILFMTIIIGISFIFAVIIEFLESFILIRNDNNEMIQKINEILPQTQCGKCGYSGCLPYATAIVKKNDIINKCIPGSNKVLKDINYLLNHDINDFYINDNIIDLTNKRKVAIIDEKNCIGCTKCIKLCPVNAIVGSIRNIHSVLSDLCTGCELCIQPCPTDCIYLIEIYNI